VSQVAAPEFEHDGRQQSQNRDAQPCVPEDVDAVHCAPEDDPDDEITRSYLFEAYHQKSDLLTLMAERVTTGE